MTISFVNRFDGTVHFTRHVSDTVPMWYLNMLSVKLKLDIQIN